MKSKLKIFLAIAIVAFDPKKLHLSIWEKEL